MTSERYKRVREIYHEVCEQAADEREALLIEACSNDDELLVEVRSLLRHHDEEVGALVDLNIGFGQQLITRDATAGDVDVATGPLSGPAKVGRYRIIRKLGEGGMGVVYLAEQDQPRRFVAVKVIRTGLMSRELSRRFEFEAEVLGQLHHPGIAHIYEFGTADSDGGQQSFFAMEYVEGLTLDQYVREHQLDTRERLKLMTLICDAIQHAHQKGVIHRDLKPGNILVRDEATERRSDEGRTQRERQNFSRSDRVAEVDATGEDGLSHHRGDARHGAFRVDQSDETGHSLGAVEHRRGPRPRESKRLHPVSEDGPRLADGASDPGDIESGSGVSDDRPRSGGSPGRDRSSSSGINPRARTTSKIARWFGFDHFLPSVASSLRRHVASAPSVASSLRRSVAQPVILDFGVARATNADTQIVTMQTNAGQLIGTLPYMSPEQVSGAASSIDTRSDVFALGVICFELLTHRLPHELRDRSIPEAARIIRDEEPSRLGSTNPSLRGDLETIVAKALEKDRSRRYQTAAELSADIGRYLRNEPILARPHSALYQLRKFARRNRGLALALCGVLLALVAGLASTLIYAIREHRQRQVSERRFEDLRSFSHNVIVDYQNMQREKGETEARKYLTGLAQKYLDMLVGESSDLNPKARADLAMSYAVIGDILGQPNSANLGDPLAALANYEKSIAITQELARHDPDNIELQRYLAIRYERAGNVHLFEENYDKALACYEKSQAIKLAIAEKDPDGQRNLSFSYNKLGDVYIKINRRVEAHDMYVKSLDIRKRLADLSPKNEGIQRDYMVGLNRVGDVLMELGRTDEALQHYEASLARRIELADLQPDNTRARMDVAVGHFKRGEGLAALDRGEEALAAYRTSRSMLNELCEKDPANMTARFGAAEMSGQIGNVLLKSGRLEAALDAFTEQTRDIEAAIPEEKMSASQRQTFAQGHQLRGQALLKLAKAEGKTPVQSQEYHEQGCAALRRAKELFLALARDKTGLPQELVALLVECELAGDTP
jgi:serine/threonine protein kinase